MNRREFIRTAIATTTLMAVGATGIFEAASKVGANQSNAQVQGQQVQPPPISSQTSQTSAPQVSSEPPTTTTSQPPTASSATSQSQSASIGSSSSQSTAVTSQASASSSQSISTSSQSSSAAAPAGYVLVAQISALSGKTSVYFNHPSHGNSILLNLSGVWKAFSATCTHRPCTVNFQSTQLYCPCHGATFSASNGSVTRCPAQVRLGEYGVVEQDGGVYVSDAIIN